MGLLSTLAAQSVLLRDIRAGLEPFAAIDASELNGWIPKEQIELMFDDELIAVLTPGHFMAAAALLARINALHPEKETRGS